MQNESTSTPSFHDTENNWGSSKKVLFYFGSIYTCLYIFFPILLYRYKTLENFILWVGKHILQIDYEILTRMTGSGDRTFDYVQFFVIAFFSILGCTLCTLFAKKRRYDKELIYLTILIRFYLAMMMFSYGLAKIFVGQFPFLSLHGLLRSYGDSSPMGLLWSFMGYSSTYTAFTGLAEILGGLLLVSRRATTLGALVTVGVMSNIVVLNFCYDVPVKLFSSHLLLFALFLVARDRKRLFAFFFRNHAVPYQSLETPFQSRNGNLFGLAMKGFFLTLFLFQPLYHWTQRITPPKPPLYGIYEVETFRKNEKIVPPLLTDETRWKQLVINWSGYVSIEFCTGKKRVYQSRTDIRQQTITLLRYGPKGENIVINFQKSQEGNLQLSWKFQEDMYQIETKKHDPKDFLLVKRGFHWINEVPFNR